MQHKSTVLAVLALLGVSLVFAGCVIHPRHRPHWPHHRHHLQVPVDSLLPMQQPNPIAMLSTWTPEDLCYSEESHHLRNSVKSTQFGVRSVPPLAGATGVGNPGTTGIRSPGPSGTQHPGTRNPGVGAHTDTSRGSSPV